nr:MAG TPA: hypothetical protein [Caudoviricetes sp.]
MILKTKFLKPNNLVKIFTKGLTFCFFYQYVVLVM